MYLIWGATSVVSGAVSDAAGCTLVAEGDSDRLGDAHTLSAPLDVDGDGLQDVLVGGYGEGTGPTNKGAAYVVLGAPARLSGVLDIGTAADWRVGGDAYLDLMGFSTGPAGDVDGDGYDDFLVAAIGVDGSAPEGEGRVYVYGGRAGLAGSGSAAAEAMALLDGGPTDGAFGFSVAGADLDADGWSDVVVGADSSEHSAPASGPRSCSTVRSLVPGPPRPPTRWWTGARGRPARAQKCSSPTSMAAAAPTC